MMGGNQILVFKWESPSLLDSSAAVSKKQNYFIILDKAGSPIAHNMRASVATFVGEISGNFDETWRLSLPLLASWKDWQKVIQAAISLSTKPNCALFFIFITYGSTPPDSFITGLNAFITKFVESHSSLTWTVDSVPFSFSSQLPPSISRSSDRISRMMAATISLSM